MLGLETALALALTELNLPIAEVLGLLSWRPAAIAGLNGVHGGPIAPDAPANLCVFDPDEEWTVDPDDLASRSRNTPYAGRRVRGRVRHTVVGGHPVVVNQGVAAMSGVEPAALVLSDGEVFEGEAIGAAPPGGITSGEVVFNTVLTGYQEVITDPSYAGQIITFTYPHIGNYGVTPDDHESRRPFCRGVIVRDMARRRSNWRATGDLEAFLVNQGIAGLAGVDTRRLTSHIRDAGAMPGAFGTATESDLLAAAIAEPGTDGIDLVATVTRSEPEHFSSTRADGRAPRRVVALDYGLKATIVRHLRTIAAVEVVPATMSAADILARQPHGVFLSNGPGDPEAVVGATETIAALLGEGPHLRHLPGPPVAGRNAGRGDREAPLRPPRRQPPGSQPGHRRGGDHQPEPQLLRH